MLADISLRLAPGEWLGISGDSGSGKSTLGKLLSGQLTPSQGSVQVDGSPLPTRGLRPVQWLPQSPELAVNPRWRVGKILREAWTPPDTLMEAFGIEDEWLKRFPSALSGGELQRVCVLRALAPGVRYVVADEISTMLDPITQLSLWQALKAHAEHHQLGVIVISHDTALLNRLCHQQWHLAGGSLRISSTALKAP
ncbi:MAG TPA: nickel ABC transporter ATP-binding protein [Halomonas sp.]|nr:nickel ABC transporter ATP-binding protein [Halomonas sp.]